MTEKQQRLAIQSLVKAGWMLYDLRKGPDGRIRRYFKPLMEVTTAFSPLPKGGGPPPKGQGTTSPREESSISEITTESSVSNETASPRKEYLDLDADGLPIRKVVKLSPGKSPEARAIQSNILKLIFWAEKRRGAEFPNRKKQMKALNRCVEIGATISSVQNRWVDLEKDDFYGKNGIDFMSVLNSFDKKPWNKDWN